MRRSMRLSHSLAGSSQEQPDHVRTVGKGLSCSSYFCGQAVKCCDAHWPSGYCTWALAVLL